MPIERIQSGRGPGCVVSLHADRSKECRVAPIWNPGWEVGYYWLQAYMVQDIQRLFYLDRSGRDLSVNVLYCSTVVNTRQSGNLLLVENAIKTVHLIPFVS
jgi:hypothetical protein